MNNSCTNKTWYQLCKMFSTSEKTSLSSCSQYGNTHSVIELLIKFNPFFRCSIGSELDGEIFYKYLYDKKLLILNETKFAYIHKPNFLPTH